MEQQRFYDLGDRVLREPLNAEASDGTFLETFSRWSTTVSSTA